MALPASLERSPHLTLANADASMTIDDLARAGGVTTRNIRAYQTRGLLPPPMVRGRVGYYGAAHVARLRLIEQLQQRGFSLAAIAEVMSAWSEGRGLADLIGFEEALTMPWAETQRMSISRADLVRRFGMPVDETLLKRAMGLGILAPEGEGFRVTSPRLFEIGGALASAGIPVDAIIKELAAMRPPLDSLAQRFVALFIRHVWQPFAARGMPARELPTITGALQKVRPLASSAIEAVFLEAMERAVGAAMPSMFKKKGAARPRRPSRRRRGA